MPNETSHEDDILARITEGTVLEYKVDLSQPAKPVEWIDFPFIARQQVTVLAGAPGGGKSLVGLHSAIRLANEGYKVLIVDVENGPRLVVERLNKLGMDDKARSNITVYTPNGFDFADSDGESFMAFQRMVELEQPDVMFLDSLRSMYGASLASRKIGTLLELLRIVAQNSNAGVVVIHHTTKSGNTYLGSGAIGSVVEMVYYMLRHKDDPDITRRVITVEKQRLTQEPDDVWLRITSEADGEILDIQPAEPFIPPAKGAKNQLTFLVLTHVIAGTSHKGAPLTMAEIAARVGRQPNDVTLRRVVQALVEQGKLAVDKAPKGNANVYWVPKESTTVRKPNVGTPKSLTTNKKEVA